MDERDIIVIGGSSGATAPLKAILGGLSRDLPAAVFVVLYIPARSIGILATVTQAASNLPVQPAEDGMEIRPGHVYLGVPDRHLLLADGRIRLGRGPRENMARPAIDPLFRSAAIAYGPRVVGVLLSGLLNDGASGLSAIKRCGGLALVQDPQDAIADEMPLAGLRAVSADLVAPGERIGDVLADLAAMWGTVRGTRTTGGRAATVEDMANGRHEGGHYQGCVPRGCYGFLLVSSRSPVMRRALRP